MSLLVCDEKNEGRGKGELTVIIVITHNHLFDLTELAHLAPEVLVEGIKVILQLTGIHLVLRVVRWVLVEVREQDSLAVGRLDVLARAPVAVPARPDLVVERAVHLVGLSAEDAGEVVRHVVGCGVGSCGVEESASSIDGSER
jgi:hypothetical protein